ncbi:hypothetical protein ACJIZ3_013790 [Penstemon smallii]|uniref:Uncharacterized protein n=1 Tax=Penstemon smallii TaxID=265156 RepID=A0ABD3RHN2_9LAMI
MEENGCLPNNDTYNIFLPTYLPLFDMDECKEKKACQCPDCSFHFEPTLNLFTLVPVNYNFFFFCPGFSCSSEVKSDLAAAAVGLFWLDSGWLVVPTSYTNMDWGYMNFVLFLLVNQQILEFNCHAK